MPASVAISGRVQLPDGTPANGAVIWATPRPPEVDLRGGSAISPAPVVFTADETGVFAGDLVAGDWTLRIRWNARPWPPVQASVPGPVFAGPAALTASEMTALWRDGAGALDAVDLTFTPPAIRVVSGVIVLPDEVAVSVGANGGVSVALVAGEYDVRPREAGRWLPTFRVAAPGDWLSEDGRPALWGAEPALWGAEPATWGNVA